MIRASALIGGAISLAGAGMMAGWLFELQAIVRAFPGFLMVFDTALGFTIAGAALAVGAFVPAQRRALHTGAGAALLALGALVLAQYVFGVRLGVDWPGLHAWMIDAGTNPFPGRMSPATCVGFMLAGMVLLFVPRIRGTAPVLAVRALTFAIAVLGAVSVAGFGLDLADLLPAYWLNQVSMPTAASFLLLALALWLDWRAEPWNALRLIQGEDDRIALAGAFVVAASIAVTGGVMFWFMQTSIDRILAGDLAYALKSHHAVVGNAIENAIQATLNAADRPNIRRLYDAPSGDRPRPDSAAFLPVAASSLVKSGFSAFAFYDAGGRELARAGVFADAAELRMPLLHRARGVEILWQDGFVLNTRADIVEGGRRLGEVRAQHALPELENLIRDSAELGATSEFTFCAILEGTLRCAPSRFQPRPFDVPVVPGSRVPVSYALEGSTGVQKLTDYRGKRVLAAYAPFRALGVGTVLKTDLAELYAPIRDRIGYFVAALFVLSAAGGWAVRRRVHPLARRLMLEKQRLGMALEGSRLVLWDWDIASGRVRLSEEWSALLGGVPRASETSIRNLRELVHAEDAAPVGEQVRAMLKGTISHYAYDHRVRTDSGAWKWIRSRGRVVERDPGGGALRAIGTNVDIDERKHRELEAAHRADHDALTGLPNRAMFRDRLEQALLRSRRSGKLMAVIFLDVDKFKLVNDSLGHAAGDALLQEYARRLLAGVRSSDTVARFGGDEFAVILEDLGSRDDGIRIASNIVGAMRAAFTLDGHAASASTSAGIALHDAANETSIGDLLKSADAALYEAKKAGRDRVVVSNCNAAAGQAEHEVRAATS